MTICLQCSADNPDFQTFCEQCGESLKHWWAIVRGLPGVQKFYGSADDRFPQHELSAPQGSPYPLSTQTSQVRSGQDISGGRTNLLFLDVQRRYRFLSPLSANNYLRTEADGLSWELQAQVLDLKPHNETVLTRLDLDLSRDVPQQVHPYLNLQKELYPAIPLVHDAWQHEGQDVLLLEDRTHLPLLQTVCSQSIPSPFQVLDWLQEMVKIWIDLEAWSCCRSLLELSNLRVDANQKLCLQRLYSDSLASSGMSIHPLPDLGLTWEMLFQNMSPSMPDSGEPALPGQITSLIACVSANMIGSPSDLQMMLNEIIQELKQEQVYLEVPQPAVVNLMSSESDLAEQQRQAELLDLFSLPNLPNNSAAAPDFSSEVDDIDPTERFTSPTPVAAVASSTENDEIEDDTPTLMLPMRLSNVDVFSLTDTGKQRGHNEDYFSAETSLIEAETPKGRVLKAKGLYILCDGMGGHEGGEVASSLAVQTLQKFFHQNWFHELPDLPTISTGVLEANSVVHAVNQECASSGNARMGTTAVVALLDGNRLAYAHVGDSRLYRLTRKFGLEQLTSDHEVGQREMQRGIRPEVAYARPDAYQLTQALGPRDSAFIKPDIAYLNIREDSLFLLCSDGLTDNDLLEIYWQSHLLPLLSAKSNLDQGIQQLVDLANQYNGHDNISVIAFRVKVTPDLSTLTG